MDTCKYEDDSHYESIIESPHTNVDKCSELSGWDRDGQVLECTRDASDSDFCKFHQKLEADNNKSEELIEELRQNTDRPLLLIEANLSRLIIEDMSIERPIWIIGSTFENRFEIEESDFNSSVIFDGSTFRDITRFNSVTFNGTASLSDARFLQESEFQKCEFVCESRFNNVHFDNQVIFDRVRTKADCSFQHAEFHEETYFASCRFEDRVNFYAAEFMGNSKIARARDVDVIDAQINSETRFDSQVNFEKVIFTQDGRINIKSKDEIIFKNANLSDCDISDVNLCGANLENADLTNSILYNTDLRGCKIWGCDFSGARINRNTQFLGHPSTKSTEGHEHSISSIIRTKRCYYDPQSEFEHSDIDSTDDLRTKARTVYRQLQRLAMSTAHLQLQTRCFVRRKDMERNRYWNDILSVESGLLQPAIAGVRWLRAKLSRVIMLYGESPWRVIFWSIFAIASFALFYMTFGLIQQSDRVVQVGLDGLVADPVSYINTFSGTLYYSALIFTNLSFGRYSPVGFGTYATAIETTIGLTMLALFFFVLGRRAAK
jgi:uncharacterized protein YjbI with pentapeptide repeats